MHGTVHHLVAQISKEEQAAVQEVIKETQSEGNVDGAICVYE